MSEQRYLHGIPQSYWAGCRCFPCCVASADYQRARYLERAKGRRKDHKKSGRARIAIRGIGTQIEIAEMLGVSQATISRIRSGKKIRPETERKILRAA